MPEDELKKQKYCEICDKDMPDTHYHKYPDIVVTGSGAWDYAEGLTDYKLHHPRFFGMLFGGPDR